ncbi:MAG: LysR family transcriptional regulator [Hahellaceae bacterium]|nr:LysR family transcriptional regulator [Hahellaceae bacterium]
MVHNLNFKHLYYFWVIAREGSIIAASRELHLAPQTLSGQLASLEESLGGLLFKREGKQLILTHLGRTLLPYADDMFRVAEELKRVAALVTTQQSIRLAVGIASSIHKLYAYRMIEPALKLDREVTLSSRSGSIDFLVQELDHHRLDMVLTDRLPTLQRDNPLHWYELERSSITLFAAPGLSARLIANFPLSLDSTPFLVSTLESPYVHELMQWFERQGVRPKVRAEVDDSALMKVLGAHELGVFAAPTAVADEVCRQYHVVPIGKVDSISERIYAVTRARSAVNPAVEAICRRSLA